MKRTGDDFVGPARQRSGWLIPLAVFAVTAALATLILLYYFAPAPAQFSMAQPAPTDSTDLVMLSVGETSFHIPSNYIVFAAERGGGAVEQVSLIALLPELQGYTLAQAPEFGSNAPDSRVVNMVIRNEIVALSEAERFSRIYSPVLATPEGTRTEFGLARYTFRADSGYRDEELYVGEVSNGPILIRCTRPTDSVPSPSCLGDLPLGDGLTVSYRFKRAHIETWQDVVAGVRALVGAFTVKS